MTELQISTTDREPSRCAHAFRASSQPSLTKVELECNALPLPHQNVRTHGTVTVTAEPAHPMFDLLQWDGTSRWWET